MNEVLDVESGEFIEHPIGTAHDVFLTVDGEPASGLLVACSDPHEAFIFAVEVFDPFQLSLSVG